MPFDFGTKMWYFVKSYEVKLKHALTKIGAFSVKNEKAFRIPKLKKKLMTKILQCLKVKIWFLDRKKFYNALK